jgi:hypothetical protein
VVFAPFGREYRSLNEASRKQRSLATGFNKLVSRCVRNLITPFVLGDGRGTLYSNRSRLVTVSAHSSSGLRADRLEHREQSSRRVSIKAIAFQHSYGPIVKFVGSFCWRWLLAVSLAQQPFKSSGTPKAVFSLAPDQSGRCSASVRPYHCLSRALLVGMPASSAFCPTALQILSSVEHCPSWASEGISRYSGSVWPHSPCCQAILLEMSVGSVCLLPTNLSKRSEHLSRAVFSRALNQGGRRSASVWPYRHLLRAILVEKMSVSTRLFRPTAFQSWKSFPNIEST